MAMIPDTIHIKIDDLGKFRALVDRVTQLERDVYEDSQRLSRLEQTCIPAELRERPAAPASDAALLRDLRDKASEINGHLSGKALGSTADEFAGTVEAIAALVRDGKVDICWHHHLGRCLSFVCCLADHTATPLRDVFARAAAGAGLEPGSAGRVKA
jgi:hypothetical protein